MIKLIASDVDGTLLKEESQNLNPNIYDIIRQLKEMDIHFIAASGRQYYNLRNIFAPVQDDISYIAENGSLCISDGKVISRGLIDRELGLRIFRAIKEYGNCHCLLPCESTCYVESTSTAFIDHVKNGLCYNTCVVDDLSQIQEPFLKLPSVTIMEQMISGHIAEIYFLMKLRLLLLVILGLISLLQMPTRDLHLQNLPATLM